MRDSRPQLLDVLFSESSSADKGPLHNVQQRAAALLKLNRAVKGLLPAQLHPWCRVANFRQGVLVLETANASWMMRLRYETSRAYYPHYERKFYHHCHRSTSGLIRR